MPTIVQAICMFFGLIALILLCFVVVRIHRFEKERRRKRKEHLRKIFGSDREPYPQDKFRSEKDAFFNDMRKGIY